MADRLVVDVGGTKTLLRLIAENDDIIVEQRLENRCFMNFSMLLKTFVDNHPISSNLAAACVAVAGPVQGRQAQLTNLDWYIDADDLAGQLEVDPMAVRLCNDFEALATAIPVLAASQLECLQPGTPDASAPAAIIGAGTGLGQAYSVFAQTGQCRVIATEGGHGDFAPADTEQQRLLNFIWQDFAHVSWERLLSGDGIMRIYHFLASEARQPASLTTAAAIGDAAMMGHDSLASRTMTLFVKIYGAQAGNLALTLMSRGGVYIAGGIAPQILPMLMAGPFMSAFLAKGRMQPLMETVPVYVITDAWAGLDGASLLARQAMYNA